MPCRNLSTIVRQRPLVIASPASSVLDATKSMKAQKVGSLVVVESGKLVGIFTERDLLNRVVAEGLDVEVTPLSAVMTTDVHAMASDKPLSHALHLMHLHGFRHVPVLEGDDPIGIVSARDALGLEWQQFERELKIADDIAEVLA